MSEQQQYVQKKNSMTRPLIPPTNPGRKNRHVPVTTHKQRLKRYRFARLTDTVRNRSSPYRLLGCSSNEAFPRTAASTLSQLSWTWTLIQKTLKKSEKER